jgi:hypothetical protein
MCDVLGSIPSTGGQNLKEDSTLGLSPRTGKKKDPGIHPSPPNQAAYLKTRFMTGVVAPACNPSTQEFEASLGQSLTQKIKTKKTQKQDFRDSKDWEGLA